LVDAEKRVSSFFFHLRILGRTGQIYEHMKNDRSILVATDEWKNKQLLWHGFASKVSQKEGIAVASIIPDNNTSVTQLVRPKRVSDTSWELVWHVKKLSIHASDKNRYFVSFNMYNFSPPTASKF